MGNQQAAFYYSLNYETTNDSGFFDDEVFDENKQNEKSLENEDISNNKNNNDENEGFKKIGNKQIPKSKSIEIEKKPTQSKAILPRSKALALTRPDDIEEKIEETFSKLNLATRPMQIQKVKHITDDHISVNLIRFTKRVKIIKYI